MACNFMDESKALPRPYPEPPKRGFGGLGGFVGNHCGRFEELIWAKCGRIRRNPKRIEDTFKSLKGLHAVSSFGLS